MRRRRAWIGRGLGSWAVERGVLRRSEALGAGRAGDRMPSCGVWMAVGGESEGVQAAFEPVARAVDGETLGVVEEPVEDRGGERFVAEGVGPLADGLVGRDDRRPARVAAVDDLKDTVGVGAVQRQVAGLVKDQGVRALQLGEL